MEPQSDTFAPVLPIAVIESNAYDPNCAWCLGRRGIQPKTGSHGMCLICKAEFMGTCAKSAEERAEARDKRRAMRAARERQTAAAAGQCKTTLEGIGVCEEYNAIEVDMWLSTLQPRGEVVV
jgi:hypothetical protein